MADSSNSQKRGSVSQPTNDSPSLTSTPNRDASQQQKALNINAKSFVPKMEASQLQEPGTPSRAASTMPPTGMPNPLGVPVPPPGVMPFMPSMLPGGLALMPPLMMVPPMMPPGFMRGPGMPGVPGMGVPGMPGHPGMPGLPPSMQPPPSPAVPPSPNAAAAPRIPMAPGFVTSPAVQPAAPLVTTPSSGSQQSPHVVSVGNATLAAKRSAVPPKFGCVLLAGITGVGKTTAGRQLVQELNEDKLGWQFFSGADFLKDSPNTKPTTWETTKAVFDGLNDFLDTTLARQAANPIRGLLIDKQLRGVEDLYYMTQLLRSKGLLLWGIIGMEVPSDEALLSRLGNAPGMIEKIKYHRVVYSRISDAAKQIGIWRTVDASVPKADTVRMLRTMVLGCSSQSPTKQFTSHLYHDSPIPLVDNYLTYSSVMTALFQCIPRNAKGMATFPGYVNYVPLSNAMLDVKKGALKEYAVRRKVDGVKYILFYDGSKLYLIPRHMRCVFEMSPDAWLGVTLSNTGRFVVDGDLVKTTKDRTKEKFVVYDIIYWADKGSVANLISRATWKERQERLSTNLCNEQTAFFPKKGDLVVVHQTIVEDSTKGITQLLTDSCDYPTDGLVFHSTIVRKDDIVYIWRPPEAVTADFRLGGHTTQEDGTKVFALEVFDQKTAKYTQYRTDTTEIHGSKAASAVEGALVTCSLDTTVTPPRWHFIRLRNDLTNPAYKHAVDELLKDCIIPRQTLLDYVAATEAKNPHGVSTTKQPQLGSEKQPAPPAAPPQSNSFAAPATTPAGPNNKGSRQVFGSALAGPEGMPPDFSQGAGANQAAAQPAAPTLRDIVAGDHRSKPSTAKDELKTDAQKLSSIVGNVRVKPVEGIQSDVQVLQSIVASVSVVTDEGARASAVERGKERTDSRRIPDADAERCAACSADSDGRVDRRDNKFYCFDCWAREGVDFCDECKDFASGRHDTSRRRGRQPFYCNACWRKYDRQPGTSRDRKSDEKGEVQKSDDGKNEASGEDGKKDEKDARSRRRKTKTGTPTPSNGAPSISTETEQQAPAEVAPAQVAVEAA